MNIAARPLKRIPATRQIEEISSISDFFEIIKKVPSNKNRTNIYRGHPDERYLLKPSLFRNSGHRNHEKNILRELISLHPGEFKDDKNVFEQLVRMQHFSLPTRLLDVTFNPLVGLYFACISKPNADGQLLRFAVKKSKIKYFDSDTVSCISNLSNLTGIERNLLRKIKTSAELNSEDVGKRLLQFIKSEKAYFLPEIRREDLDDILIVRPKQNNRRILAQQGAFFLFGLTSELPDTNNFDVEVNRISIKSASKQNIIAELDSININISTLFPDIESAAKYIMSKISPLPVVSES